MNKGGTSGSALDNGTSMTKQLGSQGEISMRRAAYVLRGINRSDLAWKQNFMRTRGAARNLRTAGSNAFQPGVTNPYPLGEMKNLVSAEAFSTEQSKPVSGRTQEVVSYTTDFPDSTRGTALISPPDLGTQSPLEWSPELDFSFPDFSQETFLNPSLHVGRLSKKKKRRERAKNARNYTPSKQQPSMLDSFPQSDFEPDILKQPVAQSPLDSLLNPQ